MALSSILPSGRRKRPRMCVLSVNIAVRRCNNDNDNEMCTLYLSVGYIDIDRVGTLDGLITIIGGRLNTQN